MKHKKTDFIALLCYTVETRSIRPSMDGNMDDGWTDTFVGYQHGSGWYISILALAFAKYRAGEVL